MDSLTNFSDIELNTFYDLSILVFWKSLQYSYYMAIKVIALEK